RRDPLLAGRVAGPVAGARDRRRRHDRRRGRRGGRLRGDRRGGRRGEVVTDEQARVEEQENLVEETVAEEQAVESDPVAELTRERDEYLDALRRLKAEFDNYRKRVARDQQQLAARAHERLVKELLPVLDDLERALAAAEVHEEAQLEEGVRLVHRSLVDA